jgi:hypothetical protein
MRKRKLEAHDYSFSCQFTSIVEDNIRFVTSPGGTANEERNPQYNTNNETFISINDELKPRLIDRTNIALIITPGVRLTIFPVCAPI